jgi:DNA repair protein RecO (recombination protein O)
MEWQDDAFVLSARAHGETGAIVELLTERHGRFAAHVAGAASRKMKPFLQPGARVLAAYRARTADNLGAAQIEPVGEGPAALFDDPLALAGLTAAASVAQGALPERERLRRIRGPCSRLRHRQHLAGDLCQIRSRASGGAGVRP